VQNLGANISLIISSMLMYASPLIFAAMGGIICENAGVVNIGLEGMMAIGAFIAAALASVTGSNPWLSWLAAGIAGGIFGLLHGIAVTKFRAQHIISGIAINLLAPGLGIFLCKLFYAGTVSTPMLGASQKIPMLFTNIPQGAFKFLTGPVTNYLIFILVFVVWFVLYKTKIGLRIRAIGENPLAAETLGINALKIKLYSSIVSGILAGMGGALLTISISSMYRPNSVCGHGFIALASIIFGRWNPKNTFGACLLFGLCQELAMFIPGLSDSLFDLSDVFSLIPYLVSLLILMFVVKGSNGPAANGAIYYRKG